MRKNSPGPIRVVAFDLDFTLYSKHDFQKQAQLAISQFLRRETGCSQAKALRVLNKITRRHRSNYPHLFEDCVKHLNLDGSVMIPKMLEIYRRLKPRGLRPYQGVPQLLKDLKSKVRLALISDGYPVTQENKLRVLKIGKHFSQIIYTHRLGAGKRFAKPHPKAFRTVLKHFKVKPEEMLYVGDNPHVDFSGAVPLKIVCARILKGEFKHDPLPRSCRARVKVIRNINQVRSLLN